MFLNNCCIAFLQKTNLFLLHPLQFGRILDLEKWSCNEIVFLLEQRPYSANCSFCYDFQVKYWALFGYYDEVSILRKFVKNQLCLENEPYNDSIVGKGHVRTQTFFQRREKLSRGQTHTICSKNILHILAVQGGGGHNCTRAYSCPPLGTPMVEAVENEMNVYLLNDFSSFFILFPLLLVGLLTGFQLLLLPIRLVLQDLFHLLHTFQCILLLLALFEALQSNRIL